VELLVFDRRDMADLAVQATVVEPVYILGRGFEVVDVAAVAGRSASTLTRNPSIDGWRPRQVHAICKLSS